MNTLIIALATCLLSLPAYTDCQPNAIIFQTKQSDDATLHIALTFTLENKEFLYKDSLDFSIDSPYITLSPWQSNQEAVQQYDEISKETALVFDKTFSITLSAHLAPSPCYDDVFLYTTYQTNKHTSPCQELFQLPLKKN